MSRFFVPSESIEYSDTDKGGIVHFSRFFIYMETAEHEFLRAHGTSVDRTVDGVRVSWPRVSASCDYKSPAHFGDVIEVRVRVDRHGVKSMTYAFEFWREDTLLAEGEDDVGMLHHAPRPRPRSRPRFPTGSRRPCRTS